MLHLATRRPKLVESLFVTSASGSAFPLMTVSINLTQVSLQAMRAGGLTKEANRAPPSKGKAKGGGASTGAGMLGFGPQVLTLGQLGGGSKARR